MDKYSFQFCQKIVVLSQDFKSVLLCKRRGEADFDGDYSFIGGKMEAGDESILAGLKREKDEEVGKQFKIKIFTGLTNNFYYIKKDGSRMVLPHYLAVYKSGEVKLNEEYSDYAWVNLDELETFEPKIHTIPGVIKCLLALRPLIREEELTEI